MTKDMTEEKQQNIGVHFTILNDPLMDVQENIIDYDDEILEQYEHLLLNEGEQDFSPRTFLGYIPIRDMEYVQANPKNDEILGFPLGARDALDMLLSAMHSHPQDHSKSETVIRGMMEGMPDTIDNIENGLIGIYKETPIKRKNRLLLDEPDACFEKLRNTEIQNDPKRVMSLLNWFDVE